MGDGRMNDKEIFETVFHKTLNDDDFHDVILENQNTWKKHSRMWGDKMHRICSYVAMFPPTLANYFIEKYSDENDVVLDTFSGRGTTLLSKNC
jgi:DNA modification methylase